jgi:hypothetical protein
VTGFFTSPVSTQVSGKERFAATSMLGWSPRKKDVLATSAFNNIKNDFPQIEKTFRSHSIEIQSYREVTPSLENIFIHLVKKAG